MQIKRHYTTSGDSPYASLAFAKVTSEVRDFNGEAISEAIEFDAPESWSQVACDIPVSYTHLTLPTTPYV